MPLKLIVGVSRKVGQPDYGSLGASCGVEVELDGSLIRSDPDVFRRHARDAYRACEAAVREQLAIAPGARLAIHNPGPNVPVATASHSQARPSRQPDRTDRPASAAQLRALRAIADRGGVDLDALVADACGVVDPAALTCRQASRLIGRLRGEPARA